MRAGEKWSTASERAGDGADLAPESPGAAAWRRLRGNAGARRGAATLLVITLACALVPLLPGVDAQTTHPSLRQLPPSGAHWFGTDALGRDLFARVLVGGRTSLLVGLAATFVSVLLGVFVGAAAGYAGGRIDAVLMRVVDLLYAIPYVFLVVLLMLLFRDTARGDPLPVFVALGLVQWLTMARIVRGEVISLRRREFVLAARLLGAGPVRIVVRHVLPNALGPILVYATLTVPQVILLESFLSFLGLGIDLSWGQLVAEGVAVVNPIESPWWLLAAPSVGLAATLLAVNVVGDALRDALDPRSAS